MPLFKLSVKHGRTLDEARSRLEMAVGEARLRFAPLVRRVEWSADRDAVRLGGIGFQVEMRVDAREIHVTGDFPALGGVLNSPLAAGLRGIVQRAFEKPSS
jgi:Putative polyhydroxyalkanoic acid system protein (PHA_gran_rgn)